MFCADQNGCQAARQPTLGRKSAVAFATALLCAAGPALAQAPGTPSVFQQTIGPVDYAANRRVARVVVELDRKVGEAIDIYVNNRLVARGEVVVVEDKLGITMTEIVKSDRT